MTLKITVSSSDPLSVSADLVAVGVARGKHKKGLVAALKKALPSGVVNKALKKSEFTGKSGQLCEIATGGAIKPAKVLLVGLGDGELGHADVRRMAAKAARRANQSACETAAIVAPDGHDCVKAVAEGAVLGAYRFETFKTGERLAKYPLAKVSILTNEKVNADLRARADLGQRVAEAVTIARDLINTPPNELYPASFAARAQEVAKQYKAQGLSCTVLDDKQLLKKGMRLLDAVGRGSDKKARFIHLSYKPKTKNKDLKRLVFVGKGLTFDAGGLCIKPAAGMDEMKGDMGGAANVLALMAAVAETQPEAEIHGLIASAENMPDGNAYRPGDIFKSYNGKTVEIINTDAEGRLALADALHYAVELEPDFLLDNATLTGACVVALGPTVSGFYTGDETLADMFAAAAKRAGEATWRMPLVEDLREKLNSEWADVKHMGDRWGGSITAALFLREFVGEVPWIHVDIAGPSMADKSYDIYTKGGTGHCVLTYLELIDALIAPEPAPEAEPEAD